jgi:hypothetical protein
MSGSILRGRAAIVLSFAPFLLIVLCGMWRSRAEQEYRSVVAQRNEEQYSQIVKGLTEREVEKLLGEPGVTIDRAGWPKRLREMPRHRDLPFRIRLEDGEEANLGPMPPECGITWRKWRALGNDAWFVVAFVHFGREPWVIGKAKRGC